MTKRQRESNFVFVAKLVGDQGYLELACECFCGIFALYFKYCDNTFSKSLSLNLVGSKSTGILVMEVHLRYSTIKNLKDYITLLFAVGLREHAGCPGPEPVNFHDTVATQSQMMNGTFDFSENSGGEKKRERPKYPKGRV
jgi:hypothetical protein